MRRARKWRPIHSLLLLLLLQLLLMLEELALSLNELMSSFLRRTLSNYCYRNVIISIDSGLFSISHIALKSFQVFNAFLLHVSRKIMEHLYTAFKFTQIFTHMQTSLK